MLYFYRKTHLAADNCFLERMQVMDQYFFFSQNENVLEYHTLKGDFFYLQNDSPWYFKKHLLRHYYLTDHSYFVGCEQIWVDHCSALICSCVFA